MALSLSVAVSVLLASGLDVVVHFAMLFIVRLLVFSVTFERRLCWDSLWPRLDLVVMPLAL